MSYFVRAGAMVLVLVGAVGSARAEEFKGGKLVHGTIAKNGVFTVAGPEGAVVELRGGARLALRPGTELRTLPTTDLQLSGGQTRSLHVIILRSGAVDVESAAGKRDAPAVLVNGPKQLGGILLDGRMTVLGKAAGTTVANRQGNVLVGDGSRWDPLAAGRVRSVNVEHPAGLERGLPARSTWEPGERMWMTTEASFAVRELAWTPAAEAELYRVFVRRRGEAAVLDLLEVKTPTLAAPLTLVPGAYEASIVGIDAEGLAGAESETVSFAVVQVSLPPGAYFEEPRRIRLTRGQSIALAGAEGLEMTYGTARTWVAAAQRIKLTRDELSQVRLRPRGGGAVTTLELVPRNVSATITIGPRNATWPSMPAEIDVRLVGDRGQAVPASIEARPRVSVGVEEIKLPWRRGDGTLRAIVPPQPGTGPWLLRVEVSDQHGIPLGQEFLEIAPDPAP